MLRKIGPTFGFLGVGSISFGFYLITPSAGFIALGALLVGYSYLIARS